METRDTKTLSTRELPLRDQIWILNLNLVFTEWGSFYLFYAHDQTRQGRTWYRFLANYRILAYIKQFDRVMIRRYRTYYLLQPFPGSHVILCTVFLHMCYSLVKLKSISSCSATPRKQDIPLSLTPHYLSRCNIATRWEHYITRNRGVSQQLAWLRARLPCLHL